jgi:hypothetical protein
MPEFAFTGATQSPHRVFAAEWQHKAGRDAQVGVMRTAGSVMDMRCKSGSWTSALQ